MKRGSPTRSNPILNIFKDIFVHGLEVFGRYYSSYRGFVYDVKDPLVLGRIKIIIPEVGGDTPYEYWAHPIGVFSGKGYGSQVLPQKGDLVWVSFEGGHPEVPCWQHGYFGANEMPTDDDLKDPNCYWFITPQGHKIKVNDTKSYIHIQHKGGQIVYIDDQAISLISDKAISLGTKDGSSQPAVLGNTCHDALDLIRQYMVALNTSIVKDTIGYTANGITNIVSGNPQQIILTSELAAKLQILLSKKNTLD